jgi:hypothetical protein
MNEVLRNIGRALDKFFADIATSEPLDVIDHGDPDAGNQYVRFNLNERSVETFDVLTRIAPADFWLSIEKDALD